MWETASLIELKVEESIESSLRLETGGTGKEEESKSTGGVGVAVVVGSHLRPKWDSNLALSSSP